MATLHSLVNTGGQFVKKITCNINQMLISQNNFLKHEATEKQFYDASIIE